MFRTATTATRRFRERANDSTRHGRPEKLDDDRGGARPGGGRGDGGGQSGPRRRLHRGGYPETPCPYSNVAGDANDEALKAKADAFVKSAVKAITSSRAWTGNSVIFIAADESDYDGSDASDNFYLSTAGCCDSPYEPAGDPQISKTWPGGLYGGGPAPMIVVSRLGPRHATDANPANHYSMLLTIEEGLGLAKLGYTSDSSQVHPLWPLIARW